MTTVNDISKTDDISLLFAGREYINLLGGENKFKDELSKSVIKDRPAVSTLVNLMIKTSPSNYVFFTYIDESEKNVEGIRFYYRVNNAAATKLDVYRKNIETPLRTNCSKRCYVIVEYKKKPNAEFLAISAIVQKNDIDTFRKASAEAFDGHHIA
jgi:hypothetical protein